jgi:hypothetical protein
MRNGSRVPHRMANIAVVTLNGVAETDLARAAKNVWRTRAVTGNGASRIPQAQISTCVTPAVWC